MNYSCHTLDENSYHLREWEFQQDSLEKKYLESLPERYEEIIDFAVEILEEGYEGK